MAAMANRISNDTFSGGTICEVLKLTNATPLFTIELHVQDQDSNNDRPSLENKKLNDIARKVEKHGLASSEDTLTTVLIPLTYHNKLPSEKMLFSSRERLDLVVKSCNWARASMELNDLLLSLGTRGSMDRFTLRLAALCNEIREHINEAHKLEAPAQDDPIIDKTSSIDITLRKYRNKYPQFKGAIAHVDGIRSAITDRQTPAEDVKRLCNVENFSFEKNTNALGWTHNTFSYLTQDNDLFEISKDMLGRTTLHYSAAFWRPSCSYG